MEVTMTTDEHKSRTARSYKLILLFAMVSMTMMFAGLLVHGGKSKSGLVEDFELPTAFYYSTICIIGCSVTFGKKNIQRQ
jgi:cytochrome c oxidase subunit 3